MRNSICILLVLCGMLLCGIRGHGQDIRLWVAASSDVHGAIFPYDLGTGRSLPYSLAHLSTFLKQLRSKAGENLVLLDNGDLIQGDPASYHANFVAAED
ncbi:MAG TPA: bifunctional metallophosphatase/5'-nucleotidase, partial [Bacteroidales bacterium]|nr:bifunctional metallophosphatase/5'-nucleotidase [Bacteroidales bacterium]